MRIGILTKSMDQSPNGIGRYTYNLVKNLTKIDKKNQYFFIHYQREGNEFYKDQSEIIVKRYPFPKIIGDSIAFLSFNKYKLDLVHEPSLINFLFPTKFKTVITVPDIFFLISEKNPIKKLMLEFLYKSLLNKTDKIIVISKSTKEDLTKHLDIPESKIEVIYLAVDKRYKVISNRKALIGKLEKKYKINPPFVLFVGELGPRKNLCRLIEAFHKLKINENLKHKLVVVGKKGRDYKEIFRTIDGLGIRNEIIFAGCVPEEDLISFYNTAGLFVFPSLYEGFGLPILEAMACGCPVVTSNTSSLPEVAGETAMMVNPYDVDALAKTIEKVLTNEGLRKEMIEKGLKQVKKFNWESTAEQTLKIYQEVYEKKNYR